MWELDHKEDWPWKNWPIQTVMLGKTVKSPLDGKGIKQANPKVTQPWMFIGRADAEDEAPMLWPPYVKSQPFGKVPDAGKDWVEEEKGATEGEMFGWHHWLNGREFEQTLGDGEWEGNLASYSPWGQKE